MLILLDLKATIGCCEGRCFNANEIEVSRCCLETQGRKHRPMLFLVTKNAKPAGEKGRGRASLTPWEVDRDKSHVLGQAVFTQGKVQHPWHTM